VRQEIKYGYFSVLAKSCKNIKYYIVREDRNLLHRIKVRKANWIGHILRRNCLLKHVMEGKIEGKIEVRERRG
jgi:hypothetical protein